MLDSGIRFFCEDFVQAGIQIFFIVTFKYNKMVVISVCCSVLTSFLGFVQAIIDQRNQTLKEANTMNFKGSGSGLGGNNVSADGVVVNVPKSSQAEKMEVKIGWKIVRVDGVKYTRERFDEK